MRPALAFCAIVLTPLPLFGADRISLEIGTIAGAGWQADGVALQARRSGALRASVARLAVRGRFQQAHLDLDCPAPARRTAFAQCSQGHWRARAPAIGEVHGTLDFSYDGPQQWRVAKLTAQGLGVRASAEIEQKALRRRARLTLDDADLARLQSALTALDLSPPLGLSGHLRGRVELSGGGRDWLGHYQLQLDEFSFSDPGGHYAAERLAARIGGDLRTQERVVSAGVNIALPSGQLYAEPVFNDFGKAALRASSLLRWDVKERELGIVDADVVQQGVARLRLTATLRPGEPGPPRQLTLDLQEGILPGLFEIYALPFLAGGRLDPLTTGGRIGGTLRVDDHRLREVDLQLAAVAADAGKLASGIEGLGGELHWRAQAGAPASRLQWAGGHAAKLPLGGGHAEFVAAGRDLRLTAPLRLPVLEGAINVRRLALLGLGAPEPGAEFEADVEPIDLQRLCRALGWPEFSGQLSGRLPGLTLEGNELSLDGALTARVFDGEVVLSGLRVIEPFGVVPRIAADLRLRGLDLLAMTSAFSFGRIEGRLDGDVTGLRLLGGRPVAFQARLATPAGDESRHRISQRAIDNISSIGGGPTGALSSGFLRIFKDFAYDRIGWSCALNNGVCRMDGLEPGPSGGYVLVKGKSLPRIDVIGYAREVNWALFMEQLQSVRRSGEATVR